MPPIQTPPSQAHKGHPTRPHFISSISLHHRASDVAVRSLALLVVVAGGVLFLVAVVVVAGVRVAFPSAADPPAILTQDSQPAVRQTTVPQEDAVGLHHRRGSRAVP